MFLKIESVEALEKFKIRVKFHTGKTVIYDVSEDIKTQEFYKPIADIPGLFESVKVCESSGFVVWEHESLSERIDIPYDIIEHDGIEIEPHEVQYTGLNALVSEIIRIRNEKGISQTKLAEMSGVKQPIIARLETERVMPRIDTIFKILDALGTRLTVLDKAG